MLLINTFEDQDTKNNLEIAGIEKAMECKKYS